MHNGTSADEYTQTVHQAEIICCMLNPNAALVLECSAKHRSDNSIAPQSTDSQGCRFALTFNTICPDFDNQYDTAPPKLSAIVSMQDCYGQWG